MEDPILKYIDCYPNSRLEFSMKKLHGIKIIYISKKKRKISNARNEFSDEEETKEFRDSQKTVSPTIGKDRLRI